MPLVNAFQTGFAADINNDEAAISITNVRRDQRAKPLLARSVPELKPDSFSIYLQCFGDEIDAHSRLGY